MALGFCRINADTEYHWIRHRKKGQRGMRKKRWYVCWSKELIMFRLGTLDMNSPLAKFRGFENSILQTIAEFTGFDIIKPCTCCQDSSLVFCCKQAKPFIVTDPETLPLDSPTHYKIPWKAFANNQFFSYSLNMSKNTSSDKTIDDDSHKRMRDSKYSFCFLPGCYVTTTGTGIFSCTNEGLYSTLMNMSWREIARIYKVSVERSHSKLTTRSQNKFSLILEKESSEKYSYIYGGTDVLLSGQQVDSEKIVFMFSKKHPIYWILKMIQNHKKQLKSESME